MLVGRENEFNKIENLLKCSLNKISNPLSLYIGGMPGTGKTATIRLVIEKLQNEIKLNFVSLDCFECTTINIFYRRILEQLCKDSKLPSNRLALHLEKFFINVKNPVVILMDEIDRLPSAKRDFLILQAFQWPKISNGKVVVIGISNTLDLIDKLLLKLKMNTFPPQVLTFSPYTKEQLSSILEEKLSKQGIDATSIELCARKISALTGDVRQAFHIANSLLNNAANETENTLTKNILINDSANVQISNDLSCVKPITKKRNMCREILKEFNNMYSSPLLRVQIPLHPRILLATFVNLLSQNQNKKNSSTTILRDKLLSAYYKICEILSYGALTSEELSNAIAVLESQGIILQKAKGRIAFLVELDVARKVVNDNVLLSSIENVNLSEFT